MSERRDDWLVAQLGARMHYAVPRILHGAGRLQMLATDIHLRSRHWGTLSKSALRYQVTGVPAHKIVSTTFASLWSRFRNRNGTDFESYVTECLGNSVRLGELIRSLHRSTPVKRIYGFDTASLPCFELGGIEQRALEQCVAPRSTQLEFETLASEKGWRSEGEDRSTGLARLHDVESQEWDLATQIIVPSLFVRDEILRIRPEMAPKIRVVPYGFTPRGKREVAVEETAKKSQQAFTVLFAGTVSYRKGIADLVSLARRFSSVSFRVVGSIESDVRRQVDWPDNVSVLGKLSFPDLVREYQEANLFFLPSYLEGSATVIYEAMSQGLPILTTHQSGSVVRDGSDGYVVSAGDAEAMRERLTQLMDDRDLLARMSQSALQRSTEFTVDRYGERLVDALSSCGG